MKQTVQVYTWVLSILILKCNKSFPGQSDVFAVLPRWHGEERGLAHSLALVLTQMEGGYLLNMPRPVWQPSHYIRPVISLKLLHSKWLSRVRVICLSTGELEGGWGDLDLLLFVSQLNLRLLMMILRENKGKIFSSRENYLSNIGITTTSFLTKGSSPFRIFGKRKEFVPTGRTYGVLEHPKLKEICLFCILGHVSSIFSWQLIKNWILRGLKTSSIE